MLGKNIKRYRSEKNLTQSDLGELIGVSNTAIMRYEKGQREPKQEIINKIVDALEVEEFQLRGFSIDEGELANQVKVYEIFEGDIGRMMQFLIEQLKADNPNLLFNGVDLDDDTKNMLAESLESTYTMIKRILK